jgi:hypothetical protein
MSSSHWLTDSPRLTRLCLNKTTRIWKYHKSKMCLLHLIHPSVAAWPVFWVMSLWWQLIGSCGHCHCPALGERIGSWCQPGKKLKFRIQHEFLLNVYHFCAIVNLKNYVRTVCASLMSPNIQQAFKFLIISWVIIDNLFTWISIQINPHVIVGYAPQVSFNLGYFPLSFSFLSPGIC